MVTMLLLAALLVVALAYRARSERPNPVRVPVYARVRRSRLHRR